MPEPYYQDDLVTLHVGDTRAVLPTLDAESIQCCVTSPPYFGLRDYGVDDQIGLEQTPGAYVSELVAVFREARRVLRDDGTLWLNLGDSYTGSGKGGSPDGGKQATNAGGQSVGALYGTGKTAREAAVTNITRRTFDLGPKQLLGIPWRVAFALQADGWYLRQDIIWAKPNPMPESVRDRCTKSHEYIFLLSKSARYYYDADAIAEPITESTAERLAQPALMRQNGSERIPGKINGNMKAVGPRFGGSKYGDGDAPEHRTKSGNVYTGAERRTKRDVWTVATQPFKGAHFATFPPKLIEPCILAGCPAGGTVLDPFAGSGTTLHVAKELNRRSVGIELSPEYAALAVERCRQEVLAL